MFQPVGYHAQGQGLHTGARFCSGAAIGQSTGQVSDFGKPPPIFLAFNLHPKCDHAGLFWHTTIVPQGPCPTLPNIPLISELQGVC